MRAISNIEKPKGQAFNIGGGINNSLSLLKLISQLEDFAFMKLNFIRIPARESDQTVSVTDLAKANKLLGWKPELSSEKVIADMFEWVRQTQ